MTGKTISFLYHEVSDDPERSGFQIPGALPYQHKVGHFLHDLDLIMENFSRSERASNILDNNTNNKLILTFDDGGASALPVAHMLHERGLVGHFFVTTSMIGDRTFLRPDQIREIHLIGHVIGTHSHTHPSIFRDLPYDEKLEEWSRSKAILEDILGSTVNSASVPGGDMDEDTIKSAGEAGIRYLFTSEPNWQPYEKYGVKVFGRVCAKNSTGPAQIQKWAKGQGFYKAKLSRFLKEVIRTRLKFFYLWYVRRGEGR
ncbi:polysaccharide deacetylase family protein [Ruegeria arenilitoris]|uniref:polysaccharide deacetylase family protein n=1 Tax=Ruegeria arenilitoris TaxID=1173585 RepID=UPI0014819968|nr:polysaccharide deacetylase family protein [Ruegeria arenilitoris]